VHDGARREEGGVGGESVPKEWRYRVAEEQGIKKWFYVGVVLIE
jgi:hypothetical protein